MRSVPGPEAKPLGLSIINIAESKTRRLIALASIAGSLLVPEVAVAQPLRTDPPAPIEQTSTVPQKSDSMDQKTAVRQMPVLQYYGFVDNRLLNLNRDISRTAARQDKEAGATAVTAYITVTEGSEASSVDYTKVCNADIAATENRLKFNLNITGRNKDGSLGYLPRTPQQLSDFTKELFVLQANIADCSRNNKSRTYILGNEWNKWTFNSQAPYGEGNMLTYIYPKLKADAVRLGIDLTVLAGSVSTTPLNNPVFAINTLKKEVGTTKSFDGIAINRYLQGNDGTDDLVDTTQDAIPFYNTVYTFRRNFGKGPKIIVGEVGAINTDTDPTKYKYNYPVAPALPSLTSDEQGIFYNTSYTTTFPCLGFSEAYGYGFVDDGTGLRSAIEFYPGKDNYELAKEGDKKPSYTSTKNAFSTIKNTTTTDCSVSSYRTTIIPSSKK